MAITTTPVPPFPGLQDWAKLLSFRPLEAVQFVVNTRFAGGVFPPRACHAIEDGLGPINLDYYPVRVSAMPASGGTTMHSAELLEFIRRNFNNFIDSSPDGATFSTYEPLVDAPLWLPPFFQTGFVGATLSIDIMTFGLNPDDGSVVLSEITSDHWIFSTLRTPNDLNHPVSGNRQFGFFPSVAGEFIFYTRGADRLTTFLDEIVGETVFSGADKLWRSFQKRFTAFVNNNGGLATIEPPLSDRYDWPTVKASYFNPSVSWVV
jgi:hypothetical protein